MFRLLMIMFIGLSLLTGCSEDDDGNGTEPILSLSPDTLDFGVNETVKSFYISNTGEGELTWDAGANQTWINSITPLSGSATAETDTVEVTVVRDGLPAGDTTGVVTVTTSGGTGSVFVKMTVLESLGLQIPDCTVQVNTEVAVPVMVTNVSGVAGIQLHVSYDTLQIEYDTVLSEVFSPQFIHAESGVINVVWADIGNPLTLSDGDTLMTLHFNNLQDESALEFMDNTEIVDTLGNPLPVTFTDGSITYTP